MTDIKHFDFAVKRSDKVKVAGKFTIGTDEFTIRVLQDSNIAYLIAKITDNAEPTAIITHVLNFMERAMPPESSKRFERLVLDPDGGLSITQIVEVFQHVVTVVAGGADPTGSPRASASRRPRNGAALKAIPAARPVATR